MIDKLFALRVELVQQLSRRNMTVSELVSRISEVEDVDQEMVKLSIADVVRVENGKVSLSRDGKLLLQLLQLVSR